MRYLVATFYKFVRLDDCERLQQDILEKCLELNIRGTILLSDEGVNSTVAGTPENMSALLDFLRSDARISDMAHKESYTDHLPFHRMKVKIKREIVTMGVPSVDPTSQVGEYVNPEDWNALISDPEVILVDTRNDYEVETGKFQDAVDPMTKKFGEFPEYVEKELKDKKDVKIAMYCTGGIRCEKATSYMLDQGFKHVYHLNGGIIKYLETVDKKDSMWEGECFVFDQRVAVTHGMKEGSYALCYGCQMPVSEEDRLSEKYEYGVSCPRCKDTLSDKRVQALRNRQHQVEICKKRGEKHIGY